MAEQGTHKPLVDGSNPFLATLQQPDLPSDKEGPAVCCVFPKTSPVVIQALLHQI